MTVQREFVSLHTDPGQPGIGTIWLSRPPSNALTRQMYRELTATAADAAARADVAVVILFGGHEVFSAGDDVAELRTLTPEQADRAAAVRDAAIEAVAAIPKPTVAAVTGYALGAGLWLALAADWRVAGDNVKVAASEILADLIPGGAALDRLTAVVGRGRAKDMVFSGRFVDAKEAAAVGLLDLLVAPDAVYDAACARARRYLAAPGVAVAAAKDIIDGRCDGDEQRRRYLGVFAAGTTAGPDLRGSAPPPSSSVSSRR